VVRGISATPQHAFGEECGSEECGKENVRPGADVLKNRFFFFGLYE
jgi:hypothetical protein